MRLSKSSATWFSPWFVTSVTVAFMGCGDDGSSSAVNTTPSQSVTAPAPVVPVGPEPTATATVTQPMPSGVTPPGPTTSAPIDPTATAPATTTLPVTDPSASTSGAPTDTISDTSSATTTEPASAAWEQSGQTWTMSLGDTVFEVDASTGGRVTGYSLGGTQVIVPESDVANSSAGNENNYGSTFTLAPQADSGWPPPAHLDTGSYAASASGTVLSLESAEGPVSGSRIQVTKVFTADVASQSITIDYQVTNAGTTSASWAPWQITRVPRNGVTFFPTGMPITGRPAELTITQASGYSFWEYDAGDIDENEWGDKFIGDGSKGWLAHAHNGALLLMQFEDAAPANFAEGEGEIAIYASKQDAYVEIEPQGAFAPIAANATLSWKVKWSLHPIPETVAAEPTQALGDFADGLATQLQGL